MDSSRVSQHIQHLHNEELCGIVALGCGGVSKFLTRSGGIKRLSNPKYPEQYIARTSAEWEDADRRMRELRAGQIRRNEYGI